MRYTGLIRIMQISEENLYEILICKLHVFVLVRTHVLQTPIHINDGKTAVRIFNNCYEMQNLIQVFVLRKGRRQGRWTKIISRGRMRAYTGI